MYKVYVCKLVHLSVSVYIRVNGIIDIYIYIFTQLQYEDLYVTYTREKNKNYNSYCKYLESVQQLSDIIWYNWDFF